MGKSRRKIPTGKRNTVNKTVSKQSEIAPNFKTSSENPFQDALARKDYVKAQSILDKMDNLDEWRKLNLEGLITISQGDLVATEEFASCNQVS